MYSSWQDKLQLLKTQLELSLLATVAGIIMILNKLYLSSINDPKNVHPCTKQRC